MSPRWAWGVHLSDESTWDIGVRLAEARQLPQDEVSATDIVVLQFIGQRHGGGYDLALKFESGIDIPTLNFGGTTIRRVIVGLWSTSSEGTATSAR